VSDTVFVWPATIVKSTSCPCESTVLPASAVEIVASYEPGPSAIVSVHRVEANVELQPVEVVVSATVSLTTLVPPGSVTTLTVMLAVAGET